MLYIPQISRQEEMRQRLRCTLVPVPGKELQQRTPLCNAEFRPQPRTLNMSHYPQPRSRDHLLTIHTPHLHLMTTVSRAR